MRRKFQLIGASVAVLGVCLGQAGTRAKQATPWVRPGYYKEIAPERWKDRVRQMLEEDASNPPPTGSVVFVGSATIAGWDVKHYFPEFRPVKRGIGGSLISEATYYADQLIVPLKPSTIVFYSGDNDTAYGMSPEMVAADFSTFVAKIHSSLPDTQMVVLAIRPSIARLAVWDVVREENRQLQSVAAKDRMIQFVDLTSMLLGPDGKPRRELLGDDLHHLNKDGFDLVSRAIKPVIEEAEARHAGARSQPAADLVQFQLPAGAGKEVVERVCSPCHGVYPLTQRNRSRAAWESTVESMRARGAQGSSDDFRMVIRYLDANFGIAASDNINVNKASARGLTNFFNLFPEEAEAIVRFREKNGAFKTWQDLTLVPRLDWKKLEARKEHVIF